MREGMREAVGVGVLGAQGRGAHQEETSFLGPSLTATTAETVLRYALLEASCADPTGISQDPGTLRARFCMSVLRHRL